MARRTVTPTINAFGTAICTVRASIRTKNVENAVRPMLSTILEHMEIPKERIGSIVNGCVALAKDYTDLRTYESDAHSFLENEGVIKNVPEMLSGRAAIIYEQIKKYLIPSRVLDLGCGDGKVGKLVYDYNLPGHNLLYAHDFDVTLADVYRNPAIKLLPLNFCWIDQGKGLPFSTGAFDNTLALTVYHHCDDPIKAVRESRRVTKIGGIVVVIESVYGVRGDELTNKQRGEMAHYIGLSSEEQLKVNIFFDHFYNRILHYDTNPYMKVNVPFNFYTPPKWKELFKELRLDAEDEIHLGLDQPKTVPEYHVLYLLRAV
jgi:SAM-dependent methyltransferase